MTTPSSTVQLVARSPAADSVFVREGDLLWLVVGTASPRRATDTEVDVAVRRHGFAMDLRTFDTWTQLQAALDGIAQEWLNQQNFQNWIEQYDEEDIEDILAAADELGGVNAERRAAIQLLQKCPAAKTDPVYTRLLQLATGQNLAVAHLPANGPLSPRGRKAHDRISAPLAA